VRGTLRLPSIGCHGLWTRAIDGWKASFGKDMNGVDLMIEMFFGIDDACKAEVTDLAAYGKKFNPFRLVHREPPGGQS
jgi:hypothetical protein